MARPRNWWNAENMGDDKEKLEVITLSLKDLYTILNKNATIEDNLKGSIITVSFTAANTNTQVRHGLAFVPSSYVVLSSTVAMSVYDGSTANDKTFVNLRSSAIGSATIWVF